MAEWGPDSLLPYLVVSSALFACGIAALCLRRSAIGVLLGLELLLNAAALNFVAYGRFRAEGRDLTGQASSVFVIVLAAAEAAVALALLFAVYRTSRDVDLEQTRELRS